jgi:predicted dithiol-disulfide oxidoreductase (DUF899 family)
MSSLLAASRRLRRHRGPLESARRDDGRRVTGAVREARGLPETHAVGFKWVSSGGSDFNFDYQASFTPEEMAAKRAMYNFTIRDPLAREREGHSIFYKDPSGTVFHTYSCYDRGNDKLNLHYHYLDLVPKGRDEGGRGPYWVRRHDEYDR